MIGNTNSVFGGVTYTASDYAFINVLYTPGSSVTCSNGSTTKGTSDAIGAVIFGVPSAGTWTLTISDGTRTNSKTVEITTSGEVIFTKMGFEVYLIEDGSPHVAFSLYGSSQSNGTGTNLYNYLFTGTYDGSGDRCWTTDAITVGTNTKIVWKRTAGTNALGYLRVWNGTVSPTINNTLASTQITIGMTEAELTIPTGYSTIKVGLSYGYNVSLRVN